MTEYTKQVPFPMPFLPQERKPITADPFGNLMRSSPTELPELPVTVSGEPGGTGVTAYHPFRIVVDTGTSTATVSAGVIWRQMFDFTTLVSVTGLGSAFAVVSGTWLYLAGTVSGVNITACAVNAALTLPVRATFSGITQSAFTYPLGQIVTVGTDLVAYQHCHSNLSILNVCIGGAGCLYPIQI